MINMAEGKEAMSLNRDTKTRLLTRTITQKPHDVDYNIINRGRGGWWTVLNDFCFILGWYGEVLCLALTFRFVMLHPQRIAAKK